MNLLAHGTVISRLRLRGASADPLAMRQRLDNVLSMTEMEPAGLPATAIVVIRTLRDPLPGRLRLKHPGQPPPLAWQQAVRRSIDALSRYAARPSRGFVPDSAEAVLFMDRSELLVCLARDWCRDAVASRWWWRGLIRDADIARAVAGAWLQSPEYAPAALQQLASERLATDFVCRLERDMVRGLLDGIVERFGLVPLLERSEAVEMAAGSHAPTQKQPDAAGLPIAAMAGTMPATARMADIGRAADPLWSWVPEASEPRLTRQQASLLSIALLLRRAPNLACSPSFTAMLADAWRSRVPGFRDDATPEIHARVRARTAARAAYHPTEGRDIRDVEAARSAASTSTRHPKLADGATTDTAGPAPVVPSLTNAPDHGTDSDYTMAVADPAIETQPRVINSATAPGNEVDVPDNKRSAARVAYPTPDQAEKTDSGVDSHWNAVTPPFLTEECITTGFGGAFYLVNLAQHLELYSDFTAPLRTGLALPIWDFLALVGTRLAGRLLQEDPLWTLLRDLSGNDTVSWPGRDFSPPVAWRMPVPWLTSFPGESAWQAGCDDTRLVVRHQRGFCIIDVPREGADAQAQLRNELTPYCLAAVIQSPPRLVLQPVSSPVSSKHRRTARTRWLDRLVPYLRVRLAHAFGCAPRTVGARLCRHKALITVTPVQLDVSLALEELPIAIRLSGLDRNPGWVPAAGRNIVFHFN
jgi:hypothetical protein